MASSIGIKIANGEFYPVIDEGTTVKKRLVLTTVHDGQRSVQIDLYKSATQSMADAAYIGSLVVENIAPKSKGEPSIELVIGAEDNDELKAEAVDLDASQHGERQHLTVSMQALDEDRTYEVPDFELEQDEAPPSSLYEKPSVELEEPKKSVPVLPIIVVLLIVALILALIWLFMGRGTSKEQIIEVTPEAPVATETPAPMPAAPPPEPPAPEKPAPVEASPAPAVVEPAPAKPEEPPQQSVEIVASNKRVRPPAPVKSYKVPRTIPKEGVRYKIRWGDTLWDISEAFYRNPWLYPRIARFNKIRNPDLIISGTYIRVPPKN